MKRLIWFFHQKILLLLHICYDGQFILHTKKILVNPTDSTYPKSAPDIFSIKLYAISFLWDLFTVSFTIFLLMRNITRWILDTEVTVFHESISYFMKWLWNCVSWNALKEKFHSVSFPSVFSFIAEQTARSTFIQLSR